MIYILLFLNVTYLNTFDVKRDQNNNQKWMWSQLDWHQQYNVYQQNPKKFIRPNPRAIEIMLKNKSIKIKLNN